MAQPDFEGLARELISDARNILPRWLPGGKLIGREYCCGNLRGEPGDSMRVNINTGAWADFAGTEKGGDLISLYAAIEGIGQGDAFRRLSEDTGFALRESSPYNPVNKPLNVPPPRETVKPPTDVDPPDMNHPSYGSADRTWCYLDTDGLPLFYIARYDTEAGKQIVPFSWSVDGGWIMKGWAPPRPLYGLDQLASFPNLPVLIVEGEKAADAARHIVEGKYVVITWPNGSKAPHKADWSPVYGRNILIWPDADEPGLAAAQQIAGLLNITCPQVKIINPSDVSDGFDAADALNESWDWETLKSWAVPRAKLYKDVNVSQDNSVVNVSQDEAPGAKAQAVAAVQVNIENDSDLVDQSMYALWQKYGIVCTKQGQPVCNVDNVVRVFEQMVAMQGLVWYDEFHDKHFTNWNSTSPREWADIDTLKLTQILQRQLGLLRISDDIVYKAVMIYAERTIKNEPRDWMNSLAWDGENRLETFFIESFGMQDSEYARAASQNWWISMAARIFHPGCKVDTMIILEGAQGKFKSMALSVIGGKWFAEAQESPLSKDFYMALHGKLIIEISELDSFRRAEDTLIKRLLACYVDRYRPPYGRASRDFPRQCVFVGTTNEDAYLKDHTGARRFWPVKIGEIDIERIRAEREQLFAEAAARFKRGETWYHMPGDQTAEQQEWRRQMDEWETIIADFVKLKDETTVKEVATEALKIDLSKLDLLVQRRIGKILRTIGWTHHNLKRGEHQQKTWRAPNFYYEPEPF